MWMTLLPLRPTLSALFGAFDGGTGGSFLATANSHTRVNQSKGGPNSLVTRGMSVTLLSNALMVFVSSRPSSWTKEWHVVPSQKADMTSA
jgi:hypothetical protein